MRKNKEVTSAMGGLRPVMVIDEVTGLLLGESEWCVPVRKLLNYVQYETTRTYAKNKDKLHDECAGNKGTANAFGRKLGYRLGKLPKPVLVQSRIQELYLHNLITTVRSFVESPVLTKQSPSFPLKINLGAVDKQMVTIAYEDGELSLSWKVWDRKLLFVFKTPPHVRKYNVVKFCLPSVRVNKNNQLVWDFPIKEYYAPALPGSERAGIDWGVIKPYTLSVVNRNKNIVAVYNPSKKLLSLVNNKNTLVTEKQRVSSKIERLTAYGEHEKLSVLLDEKRYLSRKITELGHQIAKQTAHEITKKIKKHHTNTINTEKLSWISGHKGAKVGSNHSFQHARLEQATTHALSRIGVRTKKVNPRNTSQLCHKCGDIIKYQQGKRLIHCSSCSFSMDRDVNASANIALNINKNKSLNNHRLLRDQNKGHAPTLIVVHNTTQSSKPLPIVTITT